MHTLTCPHCQKEFVPERKVYRAWRKCDPDPLVVRVLALLFRWNHERGCKQTAAKSRQVETL